jgi:hypothetical protein
MFASEQGTPLCSRQGLPGGLKARLNTCLTVIASTSFYQSIMSDLLPTNFVGTAAAAVETTKGNCRVYFQNKDYDICQMMLTDPSSPTYSIQKLTIPPIPAARINTPIAAISWNELQEIRVYYITVDSHVQEMYFSKTGGMHKGAVLGTAVESSAFLYAQVAVSPRIVVRVGFQSSADPKTITEAVWDQGWKNRVL